MMGDIADDLTAQGLAAEEELMWGNDYSRRTCKKIAANHIRYIARECNITLGAARRRWLEGRE